MQKLGCESLVPSVRDHSCHLKQGMIVYQASFGNVLSLMAAKTAGSSGSSRNGFVDEKSATGSALGSRKYSIFDEKKLSIVSTSTMPNASRPKRDISNTFETILVQTKILTGHRITRNDHIRSRSINVDLTILKDNSRPKKAVR